MASWIQSNPGGKGWWPYWVLQRIYLYNTLSYRDNLPASSTLASGYQCYSLSCTLFIIFSLYLLFSLLLFLFQLFCLSLCHLHYPYLVCILCSVVSLARVGGVAHTMRIIHTSLILSLFCTRGTDLCSCDASAHMLFHAYDGHTMCQDWLKYTMLSCTCSYSHRIS
ncbi:hypothetical protein KP509_20G055200 [Ceratopteris richardii]|uniref:Uncharacterized protein n=1 Tax=Ceratopteris richardii TaxID=49495 RepID=A0A8T2SIM6_CERRI|nr:hypothetical protein KP509_20G055200 [Ceratopteris richardii]